jgi:hypothetical protein
VGTFLAGNGPTEKKETVSMSEKVVLPKFDLPGQGPHPAVRAMWIAGGLLGFAVLVLGGAIWRHYSLRAATEARAQAMVAAEEAKARAAIEEAKARAAEALAKAEAAKAAAAAPKTVAVAKADDAAGSDATVAGASSSHHHHHSKAGKGKASAKGGDDKKVAQKSSGGSKRDDAAIDKLLASFK